MITILIGTFDYRRKQCLWRFLESGASVGAMQKLTLKSESLEIVDKEMKKVPRKIWAVEIQIF